MKLSIITPTHNPKYLDELYNSIKMQTYEDWEWIILLNNGSNYNNDDPKVKIFNDDSGNKNIGYIKNKAFGLGTGEILVEADHDDMLTPDCLEQIHDAFVDDAIGFVYSNNAKLPVGREFVPYNPAYGWEYDMFNWQGNKLYAMNSFTPSAGSMAFIWYMPDHVRAWRKSVYDKLGGHDINLSVLDDQDLIVRTYLSTEIKFIDKVLYIYRITGDNTWIERNKLIQTETVNMYYKYAYKLAERDADINGLDKIDLGGGIDGRVGYKTIDMKDADIECDLNSGIPLPDNSVGVINASHIIEHLKDPIFTMKEIHRVLADGGWAMIDVPSTDGRGAWMDPTHVSYWNQNSFLYYTNRNQARYIRNDSIRFQSYRCQTHFPGKWWVDNNIPVVTAYLRAIKSDERRPHLQLI